MRVQSVPLLTAVAPDCMRDDFFGKYKYTQLGNIDFVIAKHVMDENAQALFDDFDDETYTALIADLRTKQKALAE